MILVYWIKNNKIFKNIKNKENYTLFYKEQRNFTSWDGNSDIITFSIEIDGETITFERDVDWNINITQGAKNFNKTWRVWKRDNSYAINLLESWEGRTLVKIDTSIRYPHYPQTMLDIILALRVLYSYHRTAARLVFQAYEADLIAKGKSDVLEFFRIKIRDSRKRSVDEPHIRFHERQFWYFARYFLIPQ